MTALDEVDWPGVLDRLAGRDDGARVPIAWAIMRSPKVMSPEHCALAVLVQRAGEKVLADIIPEPVATWLGWTARVALRLCHDDPPGQVRVPGRNVPLTMLGGLDGLPLLGTAALYAAVHDRPIVVRPTYLGPLSGGRCTGGVIICFTDATVTGTVVEISPDSDPVRTWLHELSHAIDPRQRTPEQSERFADTLGGMLASRPPVDLPALDALITAADALTIEDTGGTYTSDGSGTGAGTVEIDDGLPAPGIESLAAFLSLPLVAKDAVAA